MTTAQLIRTLQLADSIFPVGAFAYSDGLETAVNAGKMGNAAALENWLFHLVDVFVASEGLALLKCHRAFSSMHWQIIDTIDRELSALKPSAATRASSRAVGRRHLKTCALTFGDRVLADVEGRLPEANAAVVYGIVFSRFGLDVREALAAFGYLRLAGAVSAALRLMPLGQQQGQASLTRALGVLPAAIDQVLDRESEPLRSFSPFADVLQMNHRYVYSRLFRS